MKKIVECVKCFERYSEEELRNGQYWLETMVCHNCYVEMQQKPYTHSCFGKETRGNKLGYDPTAVECSRLCPDRKVCVKFIEILRERNGREKVTEVA